MEQIILDGKSLADRTLENIKNRIDEMAPIVPHLVIITIGEDEASKVYVKNKLRAAEKTGIKATHKIIPIDVPQEQVEEIIAEYDRDPTVDGIILQLPIPKHYDVRKLQSKISSIKDVDGFNYNSKHLPCTPKGVMRILEEYNIDVDGKNCVIIGRSEIVGKPLFKLLLEKNATVTICHSHTPANELDRYCSNADIIFTACGTKDIVNSGNVNEKTIVVDISINRNDNGKLCGDLSDAAKSIVAGYTPVPGGVGPMTVAMLMENTINAMFEKLSLLTRRDENLLANYAANLEKDSPNKVLMRLGIAPVTDWDTYYIYNPQEAIHAGYGDWLIQYLRKHPEAMAEAIAQGTNYAVVSLDI